MGPSVSPPQKTAPFDTPISIITRNEQLHDVTEAAENGDADAAFELAKLYLFCTGWPALDYDVLEQKQLASRAVCLQLSGQDVRKLAMKWLVKSARHGNGAALYELSSMTEFGSAENLHMMACAAERGYSPAAEQLMAYFWAAEPHDHMQYLRWSNHVHKGAFSDQAEISAVSGRESEHCARVMEKLAGAYHLERR